MIKEDSVVKEYKYPLIEVEYFEIKIDETFFDSTRNEFKLIGKVCFPGDTAQCSGLPGVGIYKGIIGDNNILKNMVMLSETDGYQNLGKAGTFDITFQLKKGESLMFYIPHFYLEVFELGKLTANNF